MIEIRTLTGVRWHLADSTHGRRTYCGIQFAPGLDTIRSHNPRDDADLCASCANARARRARRAEGAAALEGPDPTKPATPPWAPRASAPARRSLLEDLSPALITLLRKDRAHASA